MKDILPEVVAWRKAGKHVAIARVVDIEGSGPPRSRGRDGGQ